MEKSVLEVNVDDLNTGGVYSLVKNVIENKDESVHIDIASIEKFDKQEHIDELNKYGTEVFWIGGRKNKVLKQIFCYLNLKHLLEEKRYSCVHIHADVANKLLISGLAAKNAKVEKVILHSHAAGVDGDHRAIKKMIHFFCRGFLKNIGTDLVACSDVAAKWMFPNVEMSEINIINNGVQLNKFRYNKEVRIRVRKELGMDNCFLIGHVGRFAYQKNHIFLIKVFSELVKQKENVRLLLVGEGPLEQKIRQLVEEKKLNDKVIFYGTSTCVEKLFQAMDVFALPSHFEGLPIVGVEAQASGLPVVFSDQITKKAKLTSSIAFLSIDDSEINKWVETLIGFMSIPRVDTYNQMKSEGYDLMDTVQKFLTLYKR